MPRPASSLPASGCCGPGHSPGLSCGRSPRSARDGSAWRGSRHRRPGSARRCASCQRAAMRWAVRGSRAAAAARRASRPPRARRALAARGWSPQPPKVHTKVNPQLPNVRTFGARPCAEPAAVHGPRPRAAWLIAARGACTSSARRSRLLADHHEAVALVEARAGLGVDRSFGWARSSSPVCRASGEALLRSPQAAR
jgi:hypothetical protein